MYLPLSKKSRRLRKGKGGTVKVTVKGKNGAGVTAPVDAARVTLGGKSALTDYHGKATIKVTPKKAGKLTLKVSKQGYKPASKVFRVRG